jgi:outer membrane biosynthesis protein TonB
MPFTMINPESLGAPKGYSNGVLSENGGRLLFIAGQIAWDQNQQMVSVDFVEQFDRALANVIAVVTEAGGTAGDIARLVMDEPSATEGSEPPPPGGPEPTPVVCNSSATPTPSDAPTPVPTQASEPSPTEVPVTPAPTESPTETPPADTPTPEPPTPPPDPTPSPPA